MSVLAKDIMNETFIDLRERIERLVKGFCFRYRVDYEEYLSIGYEAFVESFGGKYDRKRGSFSTYVCQRVLSKIYEAHRTAMRRHILGKVSKYDVLLYEDKFDDKWKIDWLDSLSNDAQTVANLVLDAPREIVHTMANYPNNHVMTKKAMVEYLEDIGWVGSRIVESFAEVTKAL